MKDKSNSSLSQHTYALILAGGGGTRLWPKSRKKSPKQFLKLTGKDTMLEYTIKRVRQLVDWDHIIVITNKDHLQEVRKQLPELPGKNIIAEPAKKDTALAMLVGTLYARSLDKEAIILNSASDHVVTDQEEFKRVMREAVLEASKHSSLVTIGITPTFPSSAYGYIKIGEDLRKLDKGLSLFKVDSFTEKPTIATARAFISTGKYFWNANMYVWSAKTLIASFKKHMPSMLEDVASLLNIKPENFADKLPAIYKKAESISIDYAISEKAENLVLIPGDFGWNDVGDWQIVFDLGKKDLTGNMIVGEGESIQAVTVDSHRNLVHAGNRLVALVGVNDMTIVDTDEILMIAPKNRSQEVKKLVEKLKKENKKEYL